LPDAVSSRRIAAGCLSIARQLRLGHPTLLAQRVELVDDRVNRSDLASLAVELGAELGILLKPSSESTVVVGRVEALRSVGLWRIALSRARTMPNSVRLPDGIRQSWG
jgi:hypothetical protein